jgi:hypothetical protein
MATERSRRRQLVILGGLLVLLIAVLVYNLNGSEPAATGSTASNPQRNRAPGQAQLTPAEELEIRLELLTEEKPEPQDASRNPFRFRPPPPPPAPKADVPPVPVEPQGPPPPPPLPPIALKFIGVVESPRAGKIAALSDGKNVFYGKEGDLIEGRYKIVRIGAESIVMEYHDGQGRQTIRLSGQ